MKNIICIFFLITILSCGFSADESGDTITTTNIITGSYNTNTTTCDFVSEQSLDKDGNVASCKFHNQCTGSVATNEFIKSTDPEFFSKCLAPEKLPTPEPTPTTTTLTIGSSF